MKKIIAAVLALVLFGAMSMMTYAANEYNDDASDSDWGSESEYAEKVAWQWVPEEVSECRDEFGTIMVVDLESQHVWCCVDGEIIADADCVSGDAYDSPTPTGLYSVWGTNSDFYMRGTYYSAYAVFFHGGIAIHDADSWRDEYGGDIYMGNGSHGCINTPCWFAEIVHENACIGTPVYVF